MSVFAPRRYVRAVTCLDLEELWADGKRALLLDRDNTLVPRDTGVLPADVMAWLAQARERGFRLCLVSNNWAKNVLPDARAIGVQLVSAAAKPLPFAIWHALRKVDARRREAVLIGDQVFTDILGAKLAGIDHVLVVPQCTVDQKGGLALRDLEARVLRGLEPQEH